ncbi:MAG: ADP-ribose pyrophosphatase, partial [Bifidobacterium sp.]|nr:ADP-ribose pyrophosphatase [Bifidobacterium sp.]
VTDLAAVTSSREVVTYANGDRTMYMDHLFICRPDPSGNADPFVGDEESLSVGWFDPGQLPAPLAQTTVERMARARTYLKRLQGGDAHALFRVGGRELPTDSDQSNSDQSQAEH